MIVYKVEEADQDDTLHTELREIASELSTVVTTFQKLQSLISKHEDAISAPAIVEFRANLQHMVSDASDLTRRIAQNSLTLIDVSEQTKKYLKNIEQHYSSILRDRTPADYRQGTVAAIEEGVATPVK